MDLYQPLITPSQQQLQHQNSQIYTCSSECSDHSARHNHHFHNVSSSLHSQSQQHHTHHRPPSNNHTLETGGVGGGGSLHFENIQGSQHHQQQLPPPHHPPPIVCGKNSLGEDSEKEVMLKRCGCNNEPSDNDISEGRNCSECCSNSKDDGDTCSCSEGSCLYAEAGDPQGPAHLKELTN